MRCKQEAIARRKLKDLPFHLIFQFTAQAKDKFMAGVRHTAWSAVGIALKREQKGLDPANELLTSQSLKHTARE